MASRMMAARPTADHSTDTVPPRIRDSLTRGVLRRIILLVRQVISADGKRVHEHRCGPTIATGYPDSNCTTGIV